MVSSYLTSAIIAFAASQLASAQTSTSCQPLKQSCPDDPGFCESVTIDFTKGASSEFESLSSPVTYDKSKGAVFTIAKTSDSPTLRSKHYIQFGRIDAVVWGAKGAGIVTSAVLQSDDLDEIDWEWVGANDGAAQSNYFSKGDDSTFDRGGTHNVASPLDGFHTYSVDWTEERVEWLIDGAVVRTLGYNGNTYPQTPMQIKIGTWPAGNPGSPAGTANWAGGYTNYANAPFIAYYKSLTITSYSKCSPGDAYHYSDHTGTYQSIQVIKGGAGNVTDASSSPASSSTTTSTTTSSTTSSTMSTSTTATNSSGSATSSTSNAPASSTSTTPHSGAPKGSVSNFAFLAAVVYLVYVAL
jgi:beta-glucanase (GH16 family)